MAVLQEILDKLDKIEQAQAQGNPELLRELEFGNRLLLAIHSGLFGEEETKKFFETEALVSGRTFDRSEVLPQVRQILEEAKAPTSGEKPKLKSLQDAIQAIGSPNLRAAEADEKEAMTAENDAAKDAPPRGSRNTGKPRSVPRGSKVKPAKKPRGGQVTPEKLKEVAEALGILSAEAVAESLYEVLASEEVQALVTANRKRLQPTGENGGYSVGDVRALLNMGGLTSISGLGPSSHKYRILKKIVGRL